MCYGFSLDRKQTGLHPLKTEVAEVGESLSALFNAVSGQRLKPSSNWGPHAFKGLQATILQGWQVSPSLLCVFGSLIEILH